MLLTKVYHSYSKELVYLESDEFGVYEILDSDGPLYIGHGLIRTQLLSHFPDGSDPIVEASKYRVEYTISKELAKQRAKAKLDAFHEQKGRFPRFNQQ